jgi:Spy/CpxP family protein refolding chaperone
MARKSSLPLVVATIALGTISVALAADAAPAPSETPQDSFKKKLAKPVPPPPPGVPTPNSGLPAFDSGKRLATLTQKLKLTPEQQAKMKPILEEADTQFRAILDGDQWEEWERMKEQVKSTTRTTFRAPPPTE